MGSLVVGLVLGVLALGAPSQEVDDRACIKVGQYSNLLPGSWWGMVACGIEESDEIAPTPEEVERVCACLDREGIDYDRTLLDEYRYYWADDFITYPTQWLNPRQYKVVIGWTDWHQRKIYVRTHLNLPEYDPRDILVHELVHAITGLSHNDADDPFDKLDCLYR